MQGASTATAEKMVFFFMTAGATINAAPSNKFKAEVTIASISPAWNSSASAV
jgi:hypothetical protein